LEALRQSQFQMSALQLQMPPQIQEEDLEVADEVGE